jgi:hypothetical protein
MPVPTAWFTVGPSELPPETPTPAPSTGPAATPGPTPKPTASPKPTPPLGALALSTFACPGGVRLDVTDPGGATDHYRVMKLVGGGTVPATWPPAGAAEVGTAPGWDRSVTDGFDADLAAGAAVSYRAFAFDAADGWLVASEARAVTALVPLDLGALGTTVVGPGSMTFSWTPPAVSWDCFSFGKLVASPSDPDPSYLKGSSYLAVMGSPSDAGVTVDGLASGTTVYVRYEAIRSTSTGLFVVGRTSVVQVTLP